jgi:hypothetical protein
MTKSGSSKSDRNLRLVALVGFLCLWHSSAQAASYGVNLIVNGNAEAGPSSSTGAPVTVPGWTVSSAFTVVNYGAAGGFPTSSDPGPPDRQNQFFAGGNAATSTATQEIDVTANAADVNQGNVTYDLSGWLGGFGADGDSATLFVQFFNGVTSLGSNSIGPVTAADRGNATKLLLRVVSGPVPANTTRVHVALTMTRVTGAFNDAYADSLSLVLRVPYVVTTTADSGSGSLRSAIVAGNTITFDPNVFPPAGLPQTITLLTALPILNSNISIAGPGKGVLTVQRSMTSGTPEFGIFSISNGTEFRPTVTLSGMTITNGIAFRGGGIASNRANLIVNDCLITGNRGNGGGGGIDKQFGTLTVNRCTVSANFAGDTSNSNPLFGPGGGVANLEGTATLNNCTLSGNTTNYVGGGLYSQGGALSTTVTLINCTISGNSAIGTAASAGGIYSTSYTTSSSQPANVILSSCTLNSNIGGAIKQFNGGASANLTLGNTIIKSGGSGVTISSGGGATVTSLGYNMADDGGGGFLNQTGDRVNTDPMLGTLQDNGGATFTHALLPGSLAIDKGNTTLTTDQRGAPRPVDDPNSASGGGNNADIGAFEYQLPALANISTRLRVETGDNILIAGFIVTGTQPKKIMIRGIGPSLPFPDKLADPTLELHDSTGALLEGNDNWGDSPNKQAIIDSTIAPSNPLESAVIRSVPPGAYTAIVRGVNSGTGTGVVEAYDLDAAANSKLVNISTRGFVQTGDNILIAGTIVVGPAAQKIIIRALGPSVPVPGKMADPTLELRDGDGTLLEANDNWQDSPNKQAIMDSTIPPTNNLESAIVRTLTPANYTAIVRGVNDTTGIAVVEVYALQ